jgi:hypothetical protein
MSLLTTFEASNWFFEAAGALVKICEPETKPPSVIKFSLAKSVKCSVGHIFDVILNKPFNKIKP